MNPMNKPLSKLHSSLLTGIALISFIALWSVLTYTNLTPNFFLPSPTQVLSKLIRLIGDGTILKDALASIARIFAGFLLSILISLPLGIAIGVSKKIQAFGHPLLAIIRYIPPSAFIPLSIIWFGIGEWQKIIIIFLGVAPYLTILIADTVMNTKHELIEVALTLGASRTQIIHRIILPNAFPAIWEALRLMLGAAWTFVIIAEIVGAATGLGHRMIEAQRFLRTDTIFAIMMVIGMLGLITDSLFIVSYRYLFPWTDKSSR